MSLFKVYMNLYKLHPYASYGLIVCWWIIMWLIGERMGISNRVRIVTMSIMTVFLVIGLMTLGGLR